jgi:hypothetical protein
VKRAKNGEGEGEDDTDGETLTRNGRDNVDSKSRHRLDSSSSSSSSSSEEKEPDPPAPPDGGRGPLSLLEHAKKGIDPPPPGPRNYRAEARAQANTCEQAALSLGRRWQPMNRRRLKLMEACLEMYPARGPEILVEAVRGAYLWYKAKTPPGAHILGHIEAENVFHPEKFTRNLEAYHDPSINPELAAQRRAPPPPRLPEPTPEERAAGAAKWSEYFDDDGRARKQGHA